jgi:hypothetical protein
MSVKSVKLSTVEAEQTENGIVEIGRAILESDGGQETHMKYVVYWKQEDGRWKWNTDIWNVNQ